ncbi:hypothetical protein V491_04070 [Pseudogymnoascus sp. VKM F-3775]|nr:hypothetical protein V491_04070 [Pseudogymnoascus sp. VKM F-3775]
MTSRTTYPIPRRASKNGAARLDVPGPDDGFSYSLDTISPSTSTGTDDDHHNFDADDDADDTHKRTRLTASPDDAARQTSDLETTSSESTRMSKAPLLLRTSRWGSTYDKLVQAAEEEGEW